MRLIGKMTLIVLSLIAASPILGVSLWIIDEAYGSKIAPRRIIEQVQARSQRHDW
jgi:hypothetical protein